MAGFFLNKKWKMVVDVTIAMRVLSKMYQGLAITIVYFLRQHQYGDRS